MRKLIYFAFLFVAILACTSKEEEENLEKYRILVGSYTDQGSEGIYYYSLDSTMSTPKLMSNTKGVKNPSFLVYKNGIVYAVNEEEEGKVQAYNLNSDTGVFTLLNEKGTGGAHPCHLSENGNLLFASNYSGGNLAVYPMLEDGKIGNRVQLFANKGNGPNTERQEKSHIHSATVSPDGTSLWVADLGTDEIIIFDIIENNIKEKARIKATPGSGPRHISFHPTLDVAYVIHELNNSITVVSMSDYSVVQEFSTLSTEFIGKSFCADIHVSPDGKFLYGSNRYSDSIVYYAINNKTGHIQLLGFVPTEGAVPRNFAISPDGKFLLVANQDSNNIVVFKRDSITGALEKTGVEITVSKPVCIQFVD